MSIESGSYYKFSLLGPNILQDDSSKQNLYRLISAFGWIVSQQTLDNERQQRVSLEMIEPGLSSASESIIALKAIVYSQGWSLTQDYPEVSPDNKTVVVSQIDQRMTSLISGDPLTGIVTGQIIVPTDLLEAIY